MLSKIGRPSSTALTIELKFVVHQDHRGGLASHIGAGDPHRDADFSGLHRGSIVDSIAGHRHDMSASFERADDSQFVLGGHAGEDRDVLDLLGQLFVAEPVKFVTGDDSASLGRDVQFAADRGSGAWMISSNHDRPNAGKSTTFNGGFHLIARWVDHPEQADKDQVRLGDFVRFGAILSISTGQYSQRSAGHLVAGLQNLVPASGRQFDGVIPAQLAAALRQQTFGGSLGEQHFLIRRLAHDNEHRLAIRVERQFLDDATRGVVAADPRFPCEHDQCAFGRVADDLPGISTCLPFEVGRDCRTHRYGATDEALREAVRGRRETRDARRRAANIPIL